LVEEENNKLKEALMEFQNIQKMNMDLKEKLSELETICGRLEEEKKELKGQIKELNVNGK